MPLEQARGAPMMRGVREGRLRWAVNSAAWTPEGEHEGAEFQYLLGLIREEEERKQVLKYMFFADKKRALLSRLLVRQASALVLGLSDFSTLDIARTKGRKPFLRSPRPPPDRPDLANFNWNVSHEGDWVVLASEPICVCGVDVAAPQDARQVGRGVDIFQDFQDQLTSEEWDFVRREAQLPSEFGGDPTYEAFQRHWSCKEAFVKARGDGLGFELGRVAFSFSPPAGCTEEEARQKGAWAASAKVNGKDAPMWSFAQHRLGKQHWVTVARGPTGDVVDALGEFSATLRRPTEDFSRAEWMHELEAEFECFDIVKVRFLVPEDHVEAYMETRGRA